MEKLTLDVFDYGYSKIQTTYVGNASEVMYFPTGSIEWVFNWVRKEETLKNG